MLQPCIKSIPWLVAAACLSLSTPLAVADAAESLPEGKVRLSVTRDDSYKWFVLAGRVNVNGRNLAELSRGERVSEVVDAGKVALTVDNSMSSGRFVVEFKAESGHEYQFEMSPRENDFNGPDALSKGSAKIDGQVTTATGPFKAVLQKVNRLKVIPSPTSARTNLPGQTAGLPEKLETLEEALQKLKSLYDKGLIDKEVYLDKQRELLRVGR
jgi:hypothetical protein